MIKDECKANSLLNSFPAIRKSDEKQIFEKLPHYIFYKTINKHKKECTCTHCKKMFSITDKTRTAIFDVYHKYNGTCPKCKQNVEYRSYGMGRNNLENHEKFCVFRAKGNDLFIRCFYVNYDYFNDKLNFTLKERHRYYAGEYGTHHWENCYKYGSSRGWSQDWYTKQSENEPIFHSNPFGYVNNEYWALNLDEWKKTCLKYCQYDVYQSFFGTNRPITYLCFAAKHPNVEYVVKTGFVSLIKQQLSGGTSPRINWRSNDVKKMLNLNKEEMQLKCLQNQAYVYIDYKAAKKLLPHADIDTLLDIANKWGNYLDKAAYIHRTTHLSYTKIFSYAQKQASKVKYTSYVFVDWADYIKECLKLGYDITDTAVSKPKDLAVAHQRTSKIISDLLEIERQQKAKEKADSYKVKMQKRLDELSQFQLVAEDYGLQVVLPHEYQDIINEGKALCHCVGGYAERHANGSLSILFIRKTSAPSEPYYTMEVSTEGKIIQCRGYKNNNANNPKPPEMTAFEEWFASYINKAYKKKNRKKQSIAKSAA